MTGAGTLMLGSSPMTLRFNGTAAMAAPFNLGTGTAMANVRATGTTAIALGGWPAGPARNCRATTAAGPT